MRMGGKTVADLVVMPVETLAFFATLELDGHDTKTAARILVEIRNRLQYLARRGAGLPDARPPFVDPIGRRKPAHQPLDVAGQQPRGSLYILDEPSIGLHPRDTNRLIKGLAATARPGQHGDRRGARGGGDPCRRLHRRHRPGAGYNGGEVVFSGTLPQLLKSRKSLTADYLTGRRANRGARHRTRGATRSWITVKGARQNNLKKSTCGFRSG